MPRIAEWLHFPHLHPVMSPIHLPAFAALLALSSPLHAETLTGTLVAGGGIDDLFITVRQADGKTVSAYCNSLCGDPDQLFVADRDEVFALGKSFRNKPVRVTVAHQRNHNRFAGPASDDPVIVVTHFEFVGQ
jgi:hypothetical protein